MRSSLRLLPLEDRLTPALDVLAVTAPNNGPPAVTEYAPDGSVVRVLTPPPTDDNRDVAVSPNGDIQLFNGTFSPELSTYHAGAWSKLETMLAGLRDTIKQYTDALQSGGQVGKTHLSGWHSDAARAFYAKGPGAAMKSPAFPAARPIRWERMMSSPNGTKA